MNIRVLLGRCSEGSDLVICTAPSHAQHFHGWPPQLCRNFTLPQSEKDIRLPLSFWANIRHKALQEGWAVCGSCAQQGEKQIRRKTRTISIYSLWVN